MDRENKIIANKENAIFAGVILWLALIAARAEYFPNSSDGTIKKPLDPTPTPVIEETSKTSFPLD